MQKDPANRTLIILMGVPYPPRRNGFTLRYFPLLQHLSKSTAIDFAIISPPGATLDDLPLAELGGKREQFRLLIESSTPASIFERALAQLSRTLPIGTPHHFHRHGTRTIYRQIEALLREGYETVVWAGETHWLYACLPLFEKLHLIIDAIDSTTLLCSRLPRYQGLWGRLRLARVRRWETSMLSRAKTALFISPADRDAVRPYLESVELAVSPNGVFSDDYTRRAVEEASPSIGFLGNMGYAPNVAAVRRLYEIYRRARKSVPDLKLYLIGRNPAPAILEYARDDGVVITGTVDSIWEYINAVDVFVLPIHSGSGQQNKLLEILYAGRATISTSIANAGVGAQDGESVVIADDDDSTLRQILALLADPERCQRLGNAGARFVRSRFVWDSIAAQYLELIGATRPDEDPGATAEARGYGPDA